MAQRKIQKSDFVRIFLRSLLMQAVWNFKSLLSVGISFALVPVAKRLADTKEEQLQILRRHLYFFNAHPFFASFAIGAMARLEEDFANGVIHEPEQIERFRAALIGPLGAMGDLFFWNTVKPAAILIGMLGVLPGHTINVKLGAVGLMLLMYNVPHLQVRIIGLLKGYQRGYQIYKSLKMERFKKARTFYRIIGAVVLGAIAGVVVGQSMQIGYMGLLVLTVSGVAVYALTEVKLNMQFSVLAAIFFSILIGML